MLSFFHQHVLRRLDLRNFALKSRAKCFITAMHEWFTILPNELGVEQIRKSA